MRSFALFSVAIPLLTAMLSSTGLVGCGGGSTCEDAVANAAKVYGIGGEGYGATRARAIQECKDDRWNDAVRSCVASAKSRSAIDDCDRLKTSKSSVEAYEDYMKKSKRSEAELNLNAIQKALKTTYVETAQFPVGTAPLTPSAPCCADATRKCPVSPSEWTNNPIWDALYFDLSEPSYFQYSYESTDGKVAIARAVGDLDCDTNMVTYELRCEAPNGNPTCFVTKPTASD